MHARASPRHGAAGGTLYADMLLLTDRAPAPCDECGVNPVHHRRERVSLRVTGLITALFEPFEAFVQRTMPLVDRLFDRMGPLLASAFIAGGLAVRVDAPDGKSCETAQALWQEAKRRGIRLYEVRPLGLARRQFIAAYRGRTLAFEGLPRPARPQPSCMWIDDKAAVKERFQAAGFPVARGGSAAREQEALEIFSALKKPVVLKPQEGSGGRHTTAHIETVDELRRAFHSARLVAPTVVVEEELTGPVFRATLVDRRLVAILRRDPPHVLGDGTSTVADLVARENANPLRRGPVFSELKLVSPAAQRELARQGLTPWSVPGVGQPAFLHFKVNWGVGGTSHDVTLDAHPDNVELFEGIGRYLDSDIVGIDFITRDIARSWKTAGQCGVIECNSLPLIGNHHVPYTGPARNVAGAVWDMVFPESARER